MSPQEQLDLVTKKINDSNTELNNIKLASEDQQKTLDGITASIASAKESLASVNGSIEEANKTLSEKNDALSSIQSQISTANETLQTTITTGEKVKNDNDSASAAAQALVAKSASDAQQVVDTLTAQKTQLAADIEALTQTISDLQQHQADLVLQNQTVMDEVGQVSKKLDALNGLSDKANAYVTALQDKSDTLTKEISDKTATASQLDADIAAKQATLADLQKQNTDLNAELSKNALTNADYLKARANVIELQQTNDQRTELLKNKYGELGEPFN